MCPWTLTYGFPVLYLVVLPLVFLVIIRTLLANLGSSLLLNFCLIPSAISSLGYAIISWLTSSCWSRQRPTGYWQLYLDWPTNQFARKRLNSIIEQELCRLCKYVLDSQGLGSMNHIISRACGVFFLSFEPEFTKWKVPFHWKQSALTCHSNNNHKCR